MGLMVPAHTPWPAIEFAFAFAFAMWTGMMVGMMVPSAVPTILMYARVGRCTQAKGTPLSATAHFGIGNVLVCGNATGSDDGHGRDCVDDCREQ
jgi:predicted metal-binding membrane protein